MLFLAEVPAAILAIWRRNKYIEVEETYENIIYAVLNKLYGLFGTTWRRHNNS
jgi:hypothetical protein